jgi:hypothetical protein
VRLIAGVVACLVLASCSRAGSDPGSRPTPTASESRPALTTDQGGRHRRGPAGIDLVFETGRFEERQFRRAVRDLVRIGVWAPLTDGLHSVELETHPGARSTAGVHLADAVLSHALVENIPRVVCDIRFYPRAIRQELRIWRRVRGVGLSPEQWRDYNENEIFDEGLPNKGHFWASILAHELSHCLLGPHGEKAAQEWEYKTMRRLRH